MKTIKRLAYVALLSRNPVETADFFHQMFGWEIASGEKGQLYVAVDKYHHRIRIDQAEQNTGLGTIGWTVFNKADLLQTARLLEKAQVSYRMGTEEESAERKVKMFLSFQDPAGFHVEVYYGPYISRPGVTTIGALKVLDMLHVTLSIKEDKFHETVAFYEDVLHFNISDWVGPRTVFMRCSENHHNLAMVCENDESKRFRHMMFEVESLEDVMKAYSRAKSLNISNVMGPGRHGNCNTVHVYIPIPGMNGAVEIGWGHKKIPDDHNWEVGVYDLQGEPMRDFIDIWGTFRHHV